MLYAVKLQMEKEELAKKGKNYIELPYTIKGMDFSFSGTITKLKTLSIRDQFVVTVISCTSI